MLNLQGAFLNQQKKRLHCEADRKDFLQTLFAIYIVDSSCLLKRSREEFQ